MYTSVADCFDQLRKNVEQKSALDYRIAYLQHIEKHWVQMSRMGEQIGHDRRRKVQELIRIEQEYITPRTNNFEEDIPEDNVMPVTPRPMSVVFPTLPQRPVRAEPTTVLRLGKGGFQLVRR